MKKADVQIGNTYIAKVSNKLVPVLLMSESIHGGWVARNENTGRIIRIRTAARLRRAA